MSKQEQNNSSDDEAGAADKPAMLRVLDDVKGASEKPDEYTKKLFGRLRVADYAQDIKLRKHFSWGTFGVVSLWLAGVILLLAYSLQPPEVMIALISGSTVQVIGLYYIVLRYIFPQRESGEDDNDS